MDDAGLNHCLRKDGRDGIRKTLQPVDNGDQNVRDAAVLELGHHPHPELGALGLLDPYSQNLLGAVRLDAKGDVDRFVPDKPLVPDLHPDRIEKDQRIAGVQRTGLPFLHRLHHRVGDPENECWRGIDAVKILKMALDLAHRHAARIH